MTASWNLTASPRKAHSVALFGRQMQPSAIKRPYRQLVGHAYDHAVENRGSKAYRENVSRVLEIYIG